MMNIGEQVSVLIPEHPFVFHDEFKGWEGVQYTEETIDGKRHYTIDGVFYPSITTILAADPIKQEILRRWRKKVGNAEATKIGRQAISRGKGLHKLCEDYIGLNQVEIKTHTERENFFKVKQTLDSHRIGKIYCIEKPLYSKALGIAGRCDLILDWYEDGIEISGAKINDFMSYPGTQCPTIVDFKTSGKTKYRKNIHQYFIQGAAYATMFHEMTGIAVPRIAIVIVTEELPEPQVFIESTETWMQPLKEAIATYRETIGENQEITNRLDC
jgi:hypothetical protein